MNLARSFYERGYSVGGAGNLSVRLDDKRILVTPTGSSLGRLEADRFVRFRYAREFIIWRQTVKRVCISP